VATVLDDLLVDENVGVGIEPVGLWYLASPAEVMPCWIDARSWRVSPDLDDDLA
jgi:hypothetical protein